MTRPPTTSPATCGLRWFGSVLAAFVLIQLGVWLGRNSAQHTLGLSTVDSLPVGSRRADDFATRTGAASTKRQTLVRHACHHAIVPLNPTCPRQLIIKYLESAGFGHQFTELLFGMYAAQYLGLTFTWSPFAPSQDHGDDYTGLVQGLGLERFFVEGLGLMRADELRELYRSRPSVFGEWIEAGHLDKRYFEMSCNNSVLEIEGWWHCRSGIADNNCFWAPEHEFLFQRFGECLRAGVQAYGTAFDDRCVFVGDDELLIPHDTLLVVWHLRFGDVAPRKPGDASFFSNVIQALKQIAPAGLIQRVRITFVGGGKGTGGVAQAYVDGLRDIIVNNDDDERDNSPPLRFQVERFHNISFEEQFLAMMQADVLVGSGSSVPQVAALLSGKPVFFNHVAKHGYGYGQEAMAEAVDMDEQGRVLDSLRRVKVMLFEKLSRSGASDGAKDPCRLV